MAWASGVLRALGPISCAHDQFWATDAQAGGWREHLLRSTSVHLPPSTPLGGGCRYRVLPLSEPLLCTQPTRPDGNVSRTESPGDQWLQRGDRPPGGHAASLGQSQPLPSQAADTARKTRSRRSPCEPPAPLPFFPFALPANPLLAGPLPSVFPNPQPFPLLTSSLPSCPRKLSAVTWSPQP